MPVVSVTLPSNGNNAVASDVDNPINAILNVINGLLDSSNIAAGAITTPLITAGAITTLLIAAGAITTPLLADNSVTFAKLLSTIFSGQIQTYANAGTAGGTFYSINLGGIKLFWGQTAQLSQATGTANNYSINLPANFFNSIQYVGVTPNNPSNTSYFVMNAYGSSSTSIGIVMTNQTGVTLTFSAYVLVIGV